MDGVALAEVQDNSLAPLISQETRNSITFFSCCVFGHPIGLAGTIANIINIIVFLKMGFAETINISLFGLAVADLCSLITLQWLFICFNPLLQYNTDVDFNAQHVQYLTGGWPHIGFTRVTGMITVYITFERCLCVLLPLKIKDIFTPSRTVVVNVAIFILMFSIIAPVFFVINFGWIYDPAANRTRVGVVMKENSIEVEAAVFMANNIATFITFGLVIIFTVVLALNLRNKARWRESVAQVKKDGKDERSMSKERRAVVMVAMIAFVFILCFTPVTLVCIGILTIPPFHMFGAYQNLNQALMAVGFLLEAINSSINIFIYLKVSTKYRSTFYKIFFRKSIA